MSHERSDAKTPADVKEAEVQRPAANEEGLAVKSVEDIHETIDPRFDLSSRPHASELDLTTHISHPHHHHNTPDHHHHHGPYSPNPALQTRQSAASATLGGDKDLEGFEEPLYVDWEEGDPRNPANYSRKKKWLITVTAAFFTLLAASNAGTYNMGFESMLRDLKATQLQATAGLSLYAVGFGITPLITSSFSEEFGRRPLYLCSGVIYVLMHLMIALAKNVETVLIGRLIQGAAGSTGSTMVGGTIADIWSASERGIPMALFSVTSIGATGLGPVAAGWVEMNPSLGWRWIQWISMIISGAYVCILPFVMSETRSPVLLTRLAKKLRRESKDKRYRARIEDERASLRQLIYISSTRPIYLLVTEPIVMAFSAWVGFAWGILSIPGIFRDVHGFNIGQIGTVFVTIFIGAVIGWTINLYQEKLYQKNYPVRGADARLYCACGAGILLPISMFIYAWVSYPSVTWVAQAIGIVLFTISIFVIYNGVFSYLADCYGPFASSALAGQSLARNMMGVAFPLFTVQMFDALGYRWGNTLFALVAIVLMPIPFVLLFWGSKLRRISKFSRMVLEQQAAEGKII
ncbi:fungal hydrophobin [Schizophyllum commune Loenen D]|nr:fungal hydrophobin [Schizophyllum commune Loenen D]